jgi:hypothetical protein
MVNRTKGLVKLRNGKILPYVEGKEYGDMVVKVWYQDHIRPMSREERNRAKERENANRTSKRTSKSNRRKGRQAS